MTNEYDAWRTWIRTNTINLQARLLNPNTRTIASAELRDLHAPATAAAWLVHHGYDTSWHAMRDITVTMLRLYAIWLSANKPDPTRGTPPFGAALGRLDDGMRLITRIQYTPNPTPAFEHAVRRLAIERVEPDWADVATLLSDLNHPMRRTTALIDLGVQCARTQYAINHKENES